MRRMGLVLSRASRRCSISSEDIQAIVLAYREGATTSDLGLKYGINASTVAKYIRRAGVEVRPAGFRRGANHHNWNGGLSTTEGGYILERVYPDDPLFCMAKEKVEGSSYVLQHRLVVARSIRRPLEAHETVHHIDGDRTNNRLDNLQLRFNRHGKGQVLCCATCGSHNIVAVPLAS